ncbi:hypothetical protein [Leifsonia sp. Root227]|uniref:hypothetical protein n=1 Tax=Leifsonia sp. Root227 TaxID=1736496 RepID=UPI0012F8EA4F|nr:hypothetical protein [Leifsonia sp. Root227]
MQTVEWYEYGFRTEPTGDVWAEDNGSDGSWTPALPKLGIRAIDMYDGLEADSIRKELARAGIDGVVIRRLVTRTEGEAEIVK